MVKLSVGLLILTDIPNKGIAAILHKRGAYKHLRPSRFTGVLQLTANANVKKGETINHALERAIKLHLGEHAAKHIKRYLENIHEITRIETAGRTFHAHLLTVPHNILTLIKPRRETASIELLYPDDLKRLATTATKNPKSTLVTFPLTHAVLKKALANL